MLHARSLEMVARTRTPVYFVSWSKDADTGLPALKKKRKGGLKKKNLPNFLH